MKDLFQKKKERRDYGVSVEGCRNFLHKHCHPLQIGTGLLFSTIGIGVTAVGIMYSDGLSFAAQNIPQIPHFLANGNLTDSVGYLRDSYKQALGNAMEIGWKEVPFTYSIGHYFGGKIRDKVAGILGR